MGRGRKPVPTALKILEGVEPARINYNEPTPTGKLPKPPDHLSDKARATWLEFAEALTSAGIAGDTDAVALELLCTAYANYLDATEKVAQHGAVWIDKGEGKIPKFCYAPYWAVANKEWEKVRAMLVEFGMTPSSRSKISKQPQNTDDVEKRYFG